MRWQKTHLFEMSFQNSKFVSKKMRRLDLTEKEKAIIHSYVNSSIVQIVDYCSLDTSKLLHSSFALQLNGLLRANLEVKGLNDYLREFDSIFTKHTTQNDLTVYRACNYKEMLRYIQDDTYVDLGYMSTSLDKENTEIFYQQLTFGYSPAFLEINIPKNNNVLELENLPDLEIATYENEVLIKRRSRFKITKNIDCSNVGEIVGKENPYSYNSVRIIRLEFQGYLPI